MPQPQRPSLSRFPYYAIVFPLLAFVLFVGFPSSALAKDPIAPVNAENGWGLHGYDPVAYFTVGEPTEGKNEHVHYFKGIAYKFASKDNLELFQTQPEKYLPEYGGYCAYAMALNSLADIDPDRWAIVDGKLYLNNNRFSSALWSINKSGNIESADKNWAAWPKKADRMAEQ